MYRYNRPVSVDDHPWESIGFRIGKPVVGFIEKSVAQSECGVKSSHKEVVIDRNIAVTGHYSAADECVWVDGRLSQPFTGIADDPGDGSRLKRLHLIGHEDFIGIDPRASSGDSLVAAWQQFSDKLHYFVSSTLTVLRNFAT